MEEEVEEEEENEINKTERAEKENEGWCLKFSESAAFKQFVFQRSHGLLQITLTSNIRDLIDVKSLPTTS